MELLIEVLDPSSSIDDRASVLTLSGVGIRSSFAFFVPDADDALDVAVLNSCASSFTERRDLASGSGDLNAFAGGGCSVFFVELELLRRVELDGGPVDDGGVGDFGRDDVRLDILMRFVAVNLLGVVCSTFSCNF